MEDRGFRKGRSGARRLQLGLVGDAVLCRTADLAMMQATDFGNLHDRPHLRPLDGPHVWRILLEREVSPRLVIVEKVDETRGDDGDILGRSGCQ